MSFLLTRFPENISYGSKGGPRYNTTITVTSSGFEYANINWDDARHEYDAAMGVRTQSELSELIKFFHLARGKGNRFRYKDWLDYKSCDIDEEIGPSNYVELTNHNDGTDGTDGTADYQLYKYYNLPGESSIILSSRKITRPVDNANMIILVNDVEQTEGVNYNINYDTGVVTFLNTHIPIIGDTIKWGGEFDVPCRFDTDQLDITLDFYEHGSTSVPIVEVRE